MYETAKTMEHDTSLMHAIGNPSPAARLRSEAQQYRELAQRMSLRIDRERLLQLARSLEAEATQRDAFAMPTGRATRLDAAAALPRSTV